MREIDLLVIHCSATREDRGYTTEQLERDHKARGFLRASYNFYIRRNGEIVPLRPLEMVPAHATGFNKRSIGICYEGGLTATGKTADTRTILQKESLLLLLKLLLAAFPGSCICGHRDLSPDRNGDGLITPDEWLKACPCFDATEEYKNLTTY
ncbi:MAG: N-acetylmuramoyl-L-alanine amidase [Tannerellaceae bacterium]|nr:N-acetylmuramoyl-L-alanine amidase [Tannerellaceae bacterium]MCD8264793.1 N-acetylmuramoyl-L-alanine amidase [Tannerellaceae bacterium]